MLTSSSTLSTQISRLSFAFAAVLLISLGGFGWWAASRIDNRALQRQLQEVQTGLQETAQELQIEQRSSATWDDSVINLRTPNETWLAENIAEWMSSYYGHDRIYLLDPNDRPVRAVSNGELVPIAQYDLDRSGIEPLVRQLRHEMEAASVGQADSTPAISSLSALDTVVLAQGSVGIVSVVPVMPNTERLTQAPGSEFLHVSIRLIDETVTQAIGSKFGLEDLRVERVVPAGSGRASSPLLSDAGRIGGFLTWKPYQPAMQLIKETAPILGGAALAMMLIVAILLRRLRRTSAQLEVSEAHANFLAFHDALARIPNRALFEDRLERAIANRRRSGTRLAVHSIDLDRFKQVNDTLGHPAGDELIRQAAGRLRGLVSDVDTVARLGGDEFAVIQVDPNNVDDSVMLSQRIIAELERPFDLLGHEALVSASVGVVFSDDPADEAVDILRQADIALYQAKTSGRGRFQLFAGELDVAVRERRAMELELRAAINGEPGLELAYQPIYHANSGDIAGVEALVRWNHPTRGRLAPVLFIGLAEERGLIDQLGLWVLREACNFAMNFDVPWVAVNVSPLQFKDERFSDRVLAVLSQVGLPPGRLEIEITEGLLLQNSPTVQATLTRLRSAGVQVALDDFGTGYSSISYLRTHGVDKLKIDQSFVAQLGEDSEIDNIVRCIIGLARAMHMKVTAEGVETRRQQAVLKEMGCDQLQGYLLSRPVTPGKLRELLGSDPETRQQLLAG